MTENRQSVRPLSTEPIYLASQGGYALSESDLCRITCLPWVAEAVPAEDERYWVWVYNVMTKDEAASTDHYPDVWTVHEALKRAIRWAEQSLL